MHYAPDVLNFISKYETSHDQDREKDFTRKDKKSYNSLKDKEKILINAGAIIQN